MPIYPFRAGPKSIYKSWGDILMLFSQTEKERRFLAARELLNAEDLQALIVIGDVTVGPGLNGDFRFFTNNRITFHRQVFIYSPAAEPVLLAGSDIAVQTAMARSFVKDCRISLDLCGDIINILKEQGIGKGRVGVNFEMLPAKWYFHLRKELPKIEWIETHPQILEIRNRRSKEEINILRKCAGLADRAFRAAVEVIKPGATEYEIVAAIEYAARKGGAEDHFSLIASGKFGDREHFFLSYPTSRKIERGDSVAMEISPRYEGYWTQVVRTVNVGENNNAEMYRMHEVCMKTIQEGLKFLKPGSTASAALQAMHDYVKGTGFILIQPVGHNCGLDLDEAKLTEDNSTILAPGTAIAVHPPICTADGKAMFYWGETYLITEDSNERLIASTDELLTV